MKWIIKHDVSGRYICSKRFLVHEIAFARRFNSLKQARAYLNTSEFGKDSCSFEELPENQLNYIKEITPCNYSDAVY